eukprot:2555565-Rhodomonas_salina.1
MTRVLRPSRRPKNATLEEQEQAQRPPSTEPRATATARTACAGTPLTPGPRTQSRRLPRATPTEAQAT